MSDWILLRGLTREARHWGELPDAMRACGASAGHQRILTPDLPGNGVRASQRSPHGVAGMVADLRAEAHSLGVVWPCNVLAMSLGGMIATAWAQQHPGEIGRLVLVNTSMRPINRMPDRLRVQAWPVVMDIAAHWSDGSRCESRIHALTCKRLDRRQEDLAAWVRIRTSAPVTRGNAVRQLWAAARFRAAPHAPTCPTLLLSAAQDQLVSPRCSAQLAAAWGLAHRIHPWAGHDLPHDDPGWVAGAVQDWIGR